MSARKLQQEVDRTFKRVQEGVAQFESVYEKLQQCQNTSQKDKLEDSLKREIKKLQRHRDHIKTWAASSEIKDKKPLLEYRKLIETQMEKFKAVEKEMKTKAYSKEGLMASARLDPKQQQKQDLVDCLSGFASELDRQIEATEAEAESITATMKRGKKPDAAKADRVAELEKAVERHRFHQQNIEIIMRMLENGKLEMEQVEAIKDDIKWYVDSNQEVGFNADDCETIYDDLNLDEDLVDDFFGVGVDASERQSSQDATSVADVDETPTKGEKASSARRPSAQIKSPLPAPSTLHSSSSFSTSNGAPSSMKPAPIPARPAGELKYASVATAAAAAEKNLGIAPLPPPPGMTPSQTPSTPANTIRQSSSNTPAPATEQASREKTTATPPSPPQPASARSATPPVPAAPQPTEPAKAPTPAPEQEPEPSPPVPSTSTPINGSNTNGAQDPVSNSDTTQTITPAPEEETCIFHLPPGLQDLMSTFDATKKRLNPYPPPGISQATLEFSYVNAPDSLDVERPRHTRPLHRYTTPLHYPQEELPIFDDPAIFRRMDTDTLFFIFYYRQGTYQQYLAAKELKRQSWRFHKQYQTWFQRHEEPKNITEEYEQGTYRFFDYESTW
ncbi:hypothetical protein EX30DRAFT_375264 [Ascodesmis nigricans]|uniref:General negative regulator of transcription subunit n=1 Tax=Ascodesmis nigricans TaxID=341454 RepID=A0A4S2MQD2_9PEZI|nr:hypothetical protein EX30DRAFT_375264 [Ascodesmis nigricans]